MTTPSLTLSISRRAWTKWLAGVVTAGSLVGVLLWPSPDTATLSWPAVPRATGYRVHHGTVSRTYPDMVDVKQATTYVWTGLPSGPHYFAISAYNRAGDGPLSEELSMTIP